MKKKGFYLGMLVMVLVFGMMFAGCEEDEPQASGAKTISGTATADGEGKLYFSFYRDNDGAMSCDFTTNLPVPNNEFTLTHDVWKYITGLTSGQKVQWTATVETGLIEQTSGNPDYSVRVNTVE